jgi:flagellin
MSISFASEVEALSIGPQLAANRARRPQNSPRWTSDQRADGADGEAVRLSATDKRQAQIRGLDQATRSVQEGLSLLQYAGGTLREQQAMIQRLRELAIQAASDSLNAADRIRLQMEAVQIRVKLNQMAHQSQFYDQPLLDTARTLTLPSGPGVDDALEVTIGESTQESLGLEDLDLSTPQGARAALARVDTAQAQVSEQQATLGTAQEQLESAVTHLARERAQARSSGNHIRDTEMALEMVAQSRQQALDQAGVAAQAQAHIRPEAYLALLQAAALA